MSDENTLLLVEELKNFLRVAHAVSYEEWSELPDNVKAGLVAASKELDAERILLMAQALSGPDGLMKTTAALDGGDAWIDHSLKGAIKAFLANPNRQVRS